MTTKATSSKGLKLKMGDGASPTEMFTTIGEVTNVSGPDESTDSIEVTSFDSLAKEFVSALADSGQVQFDMNFVGVDAKQQALRADLRAGTLRNFKIIIPDDAVETACSTVAFAGHVTNLSGPKAGANAAITQSCTVKVSGQPSWTYKTAV